jgi:hypothetical protein
MNKTFSVSEYGGVRKKDKLEEKEIEILFILNNSIVYLG